jgi:hypothetical protein
MSIFAIARLLRCRFSYSEIIPLPALIAESQHDSHPRIAPPFNGISHILDLFFPMSMAVNITSHPFHGSLSILSLRGLVRNFINIPSIQPDRIKQFTARHQKNASLPGQMGFSRILSVG